MAWGKLFKPKNEETHLNPDAKKPSAIPALNEVMSAGRGASVVTRHINDSLKKLGAKNNEASVGCGLGIGHGFGGVGPALKPSALHQFQLCVAQTMMKMMVKLGMAPGLPFSQDALLRSLQGSISMISNPAVPNPVRRLTQIATKLPDQTSERRNSGSWTEKVLSGFLQNPVLKRDGSELEGLLKSENDVLRMVLKHQRAIEELKQENERLCQILVEELKVPLSKLQTTFPSKNVSPCSDCVECRRKQRRK